jgi:hypothetical protein
MKNLSLTRILRIVIGGFFIFAAYGEKSWGMGILGGILLMQGILNFGCGMGANSCGSVNTRKDISDFDPNKSFRKLKL